jgi:prepilin-type processing-associated H-X9-DG protein
MKSHRPGITLFQLLLVIALLALLFALLLPAVLRVRAAAARAQSQNNMKQIALAVHNYHDVNGAMPAGVNDNNFSAAAHLLPYIEQDAVFKQINFNKPCDDKANLPVRQLVIKTFLNPMDTQMGVEPNVGATNYLYCAGDQFDLKDNSGLFYLNSKTKFADIPDGTSNTFMAGETLKGNGNVKQTDVRRQHVLLGKDALNGLKEDAGVADFKAGKNIAADRCAAWIDGRFLIGTFTTTRMINDEKPDVSCAGLGGISGLRSQEPGVNIAMADGSVRFVNQTIALDTFKNLGNRKDGNVIPNF